MNTVDNLFKEMLAEHGLPPSGSSWEKLKAALDNKDKSAKKNKALLWLRIAAVLVVGSVLVAISVEWRKPAPSIAQENVPVTQKQDVVSSQSQVAEKESARSVAPRQTTVRRARAISEPATPVTEIV